MADIVVTVVAVVVCRIPSGTPGSRYQSLRKKCNRIVRSSGSKSMSSSKSLLISDQLVFGMIIGMIGFDTHTSVWDTFAHTHTYAYAHGKWFTTDYSDFGSSVCAVFHEFSFFFGQNRVRDKIAYLRP